MPLVNARRIDGQRRDVASPDTSLHLAMEAAEGGATTWPSEPSSRPPQGRPHAGRAGTAHRWQLDMVVPCVGHRGITGKPPAGSPPPGRFPGRLGRRLGVPEGPAAAVKASAEQFAVGGGASVPASDPAALTPSRPPQSLRVRQTPPRRPGNLPRRRRAAAVPGDAADGTQGPHVSCQPVSSPARPVGASLVRSEEGSEGHVVGAPLSRFMARCRLSWQVRDHRVVAHHPPRVDHGMSSWPMCTPSQPRDLRVGAVVEDHGQAGAWAMGRRASTAAHDVVRRGSFSRICRRDVARIERAARSRPKPARSSSRGGVIR